VAGKPGGTGVTMARRLLILHDSPDFGGHERMLLRLLPAVLDGRGGFDETIFCLPAVNRRLRAGLEALSPAPRLIEWPFVKRRGEPYLGRLRLRYRRAVRRLAEAVRPDTVLLVQGRIENLAVPMRALPRSTRLVSYLPMAHRLADMGRRGGVGDRVRRALYRRPDRFIVPSAAVASQVGAAGGVAPVTVAHNIVDPPPRTGRAQARAALGLPADGRTALFLGRLDTAQKGIDLLTGAIARAPEAGLRGWTFLFVGDGPGRAALERFAAESRADIRLVPWTDRPDLHLSAADALLLPSRWEGLPLTMLEAMAYRLPVLASDIDVYRLHLPAENIVDFAHADLTVALARLVEPDAADRFALHAARILDPLTLAAARARFADALIPENAA